MMPLLLPANLSIQNFLPGKGAFSSLRREMGKEGGEELEWN
jgi:hypothetical protein